MLLSFAKKSVESALMTKTITIKDTQRAIKNDSIEIERVAKQFQKRIAENNSTYNAYTHVDQNPILQSSGKLSGAMLSIKDNFDVKGMPTQCGHPFRESTAQDDDADAVRLLRQEGASFLGKAHMHQYALGITGENDALGTPKNPHDRDRIPGGSSSGSAVSVAAHLAHASLGSDTGGSVRVPSALCGLVGFKPSHGKIPTTGLFPLSPTMDHVGVLTHSVEDAALLYSVLSQEKESAKSDNDMALPRIAIINPLFSLAANNVAKALYHQISRWQTQGVEFDEYFIDDFDQILRAYAIIVCYEGARIHQEEYQNYPAHFGDDLRELFHEGLSLNEEQYQSALTIRKRFSKTIDGLFDRTELLLTPTTLISAPPLGSQEVIIANDQPLATRQALLLCTCPFSMIGVPAISLPENPTTSRKEGLPIGIQLIARKNADNDLLKCADYLTK